MTSMEDARKKWELENQIESIDGDQLYKYDREKYQQFLSTKPWEKDPHHFKKVKISAIALLKMVMHARSGGNIEVMGMLVGKIQGDTMVILDTFALPVEGTETRVNASAEGYEYMIEYLNLSTKVGRQENALGWYHSHPGYGCWLSGIDVSTQMMNQKYQEPFLAIVVDPIRTISSGKVELGAFRTYPEGFKVDDGPQEYQSIPISKIEDFGVHCKQYYSLEVSYFKSTLDSQLLDLLWNKYWVNTLASNPLVANREYTAGQITDLSEKLEQAETHLSHSGRMGSYFGTPDKKKEESQLAKLTKDSNKLAMEQVTGIMSQVLKDSLFNIKKKH